MLSIRRVSRIWLPILLLAAAVGLVVAAAGWHAGHGQSGTGR